jgi:D-3-phosphoglycerate dehydrogenase
MTSRPRIVCSDLECRFVAADCQRLEREAALEWSPSYALDVLAPRLATAEILVMSCFAHAPAELFAAGRRLRGVVKYGVGVDNIDLDAARRRGIPVANCPDYGSGTVADHAFALLIALARRLTLQDQEFRSRGWFWPAEPYCGFDLEGKTLGLIGLGRIGRKMARRGSGFDMRLLAYDPYVTDAQRDPRSLGLADGQLEFVGLETLLEQSDFVSVHCVLTPETRRLLGAAELRRMKPSAFLIDVSRGAIIDEPALLQSLEEGWIAGAGLDVFAEEPLPDDHPLLRMANTVVTPHLAWYTVEAAARQSAQAADAVLDLLAGRRPRSVVNGL